MTPKEYLCACENIYYNDSCGFGETSGNVIMSDGKQIQHAQRFITQNLWGNWTLGRSLNVSSLCVTREFKPIKMKEGSQLVNQITVAGCNPTDNLTELLFFAPFS